MENLYPLTTVSLAVREFRHGDPWADIDPGRNDNGEESTHV